MGLYLTLLVPAVLAGEQMRLRPPTLPWNETLGCNLGFDKKPKESKRAIALGAAIGLATVPGKGADPELMWTVCSYSSRTDRSLTPTPRCLKTTTGEWYF